MEDALKRLDNLTHEEARMAVAQNLKATHTVDDRVKVVVDRVLDVDDRVSSIDNRVEGIDARVVNVGDEVKAVGDKVEVVIGDGRQTRVVIQQTANDVDQLKRSQLQQDLLQLRQDLRRWLSPRDPSTNHNIACGVRHQGTAEWFFKGSIFGEWKSTGSLLWVYGKPGSGKSILCSTIIEDIVSLRNGGLASIALFYCDFRDTSKQNRCDILPSLDEYPDSSGMPSPREQVLDLIKELVELSLPNLHLCVTSRPEIGIRSTLEPLTSRCVTLHDQSGQKKDIIHYITSVVYSDAMMRDAEMAR